MSLKIFISHLLTVKKTQQIPFIYDVYFLMLVKVNLPFAVSRTKVIILFIY